MSSRKFRPLIVAGFGVADPPAFHTVAWYVIDPETLRVCGPGMSPGVYWILPEGLRRALVEACGLRSVGLVDAPPRYRTLTPRVAADIVARYGPLVHRCSPRSIGDRDVGIATLEAWIKRHGSAEWSTDRLRANESGIMFVPTPAEQAERRNAAADDSAKAEAKRRAAERRALDALAKSPGYVRPNGERYLPRLLPGGREDVKLVRECRSHRMSMFLYGTPGCGKTALVEAAHGDDVITVSGTEQTSVADIVGKYVPTESAGVYLWVDGPLIRAAREGKVLFVDEIGIVDPRVLTVLRPVMDGRNRFDVDDRPDLGTIVGEPGFGMIAATNPNAVGVVLDDALMDRFTVHLHVETGYRIARALGVPEWLVSVARNLAAKVVAGELGWSPSMRTLLAFRDMRDAFDEPMAIKNLLGKCPEVDRDLVRDVLSRMIDDPGELGVLVLKDWEGS